MPLFFITRLSIKQTGFAYLAVLFLIVAISISLAVVSQDEATMQMREKERDWLFIGQQYQQAIKSYYQHSPDGIAVLPTSIDDLLLDRRFIAPMRHLRKAYVDPLTGNDWMLMRDEEGFLIGVYSESQLPVLLQQLVAQLIDTGNPTIQHVDIKFIANIQVAPPDESIENEEGDQSDSAEPDPVESDSLEEAESI